MGEEVRSNSYEEARKRQLLENKKRFEDLGILNIYKSLSDVSKSEKKSKQREARTKIRNAPLIEPRRSTRTRNPIITYQEEAVGFPAVRRRSKSKSSWESYLATPVEEVRLASYDKKRAQAMKSAEKLRRNLQSEHPSFVKSIIHSHVYSCFWLGLPVTFCDNHLPKSTVRLMLEDEDGNEYESVFIGDRAGLGAGWRAFALEHKLEDGDALVFELVEQTRFKIYIVRVSGGGSQHDDDDDMSNVDEESAETKKTSRPTKKLKKTTGNGKKLTAKNSGLTTDGGSQIYDDDDDTSSVDKAATETKKASRPTKKLKKIPGNGKKPTAKSRGRATDGRSQANNVDNAATETKKTSRPTKILKKTIDSLESRKKSTAEITQHSSRNTFI